METLKDALWPIVLIGGGGGTIDFFIGKAGEQRAKDFLLKWWVRFEDVQWDNFARYDARFASSVLSICFGRRVFSIKRLLIALVTCYVLLQLGKIIEETTNDILVLNSSWRSD